MTLWHITKVTLTRFLCRWWNDAEHCMRNIGSFINDAAVMNLLRDVSKYKTTVFKILSFFQSGLHSTAKEEEKKETADLINYVSARVVNDYSLDFEWAASLPVWEWQKHARQRRPRLPRHLSAGCVEMRVHGKSVARACVCVCWSEREWDQVTLRIIPLPPPHPQPKSLDITRAISDFNWLSQITHTPA